MTQQAASQDAGSEYAVDAVVHGLVQGVFFRDSCRREAERLGVAGWVRNEPDGTVAAHLEGDRVAVGRLVTWLHEGPPQARVDRVDVSPAQSAQAEGFVAF